MTKQRAREKEHNLSLQGETPLPVIARSVATKQSQDSLGTGSTISKGEIPRFARNDILRVLSNEKGITLVIVLILSLVALSVISSLIFMIITGTQLSGLQKRYKTSLEAGMGGADITYQLISAKGNPNIPNVNFSFSPAFTTACMTAKLNTTTSATNWGSCTNYNNATSLTINPADNTTYDFTIDLGVSPYPTYTAYSKIVDTVEGNSGADLGLVKTGVVSAGTGEVPVVSMPYLYTLEVYSENQNNPSERAQLSILYQY